MADFLPAYERMILNEGGYKLHDVPGDAGGQTYAGIARNMNPSWAGWSWVDRGAVPPTEMVRDFYLTGWWAPLHGDQIAHQRVAETLFDFAMNTSGRGKPTIAIKLAQVTAGATPDGAMGPKTIEAINAMDPDLFLARFALAKIARYRDICTKNRGQMKFLLGWINRTLREAV